MSQVEFISKIDVENIELTTETKRSQRNEGFRVALKDVIQGTKMWRVWGSMATADIRRRYRRTVIGPFWTTLSLAIFIGTMSVLFSYLWKTDIASFLPFFSLGFICWTFISSIIIESCVAFISAEGLLKQISLPFTTFAWLTITRNLIVLGHHATVFILISIFFKVPFNLNVLLIIPALILLCLTGLWVSILMGLICARYRDLQQVVSSLLQISLFVTPIFWPPSQLAGTRVGLVLEANPLYHYVSIFRLPLLGQTPNAISWQIVIAVTCIGWFATLLLFGYKRKKLIFWL